MIACVRRSRFKSFLFALLLLGLLGVSRACMSAVLVLGDGFGVIDPVTYSTADGTYTTSPLALRLNREVMSFFDFDEATGIVRSFTVFDVASRTGAATVCWAG